MHNNAYVKFAELHKKALHNALTKGIPFPVDITGNLYSEWSLTKGIFELLVKAKYPGEWPTPSLEFLDETATDALSRESLIEAVRLAQQEEPWRESEEGRHFAAMSRMSSSRVTRAMVLLEDILPKGQLDTLKDAITSMIRNHEMDRPMFWVNGRYDDEDGATGSFLVEASDGSEAMSIVGDYVDQLSDGTSPITGAPDSWSFVADFYDGLEDLLGAIANMQHPVLSREAISEN